MILLVSVALSFAPHYIDLSISTIQRIIYSSRSNSPSLVALAASRNQFAFCQLRPEGPYGTCFLCIFGQGSSQGSRGGCCMRLLSVRLIVSLIVGITLVSLGFSYYEVVREKRGLRNDLERRAEVLGESVAGNVEKSWENGSDRGLKRLVQRFGNREHLLGVAVYDRQGRLVAITPELGAALPSIPGEVTQAISSGHGESSFRRLGDDPVNIFALPLHRQDEK